jgi:Tfp pilus tip-associated adhesin PilY1
MKSIDIFRTLRLSAGVLAVFASTLAAAAVTTLSDVPLTSSANNNNDPNLLFVLDDSNSMTWDYMPDGVGRDPVTSNPANLDKVGFRNSKCNLVYYNPATNYVIPRTSLGDPINSSSVTADWGNTPSTFTAALDDGFYVFNGGSLIPVNLSTKHKAHQTDSEQAAYYWSFLGGATLAPLDANCNMALASVSDAATTEICTDATRAVSPATCASLGKTALWRKVIVSTTSGPGATDETGNFANWYSYYRTRMNMMKTSSGRAILPLSSSYRVGFITIDPGSPVSASKFLPVQQFTAAHKANWFKKLYSQNGNNITPLLEALSRAGRYFAGIQTGINAGITDDPVTSSCQQNFSILTTDGYWNSNGGVDLAGNALSTNQDGNLAELDAYNDTATKFLVSPRPIYDGNTRYKWSTAAVQYRDNNTCTYLQPQQQTRQWQTQTIQWQKTTVQNQKRTVQKQQKTEQLTQVSTQNTKTTVQNQMRTIQRERQTTQLQTRTTQLQETSTQLQQWSRDYQQRDVQWERKTLQLQSRTKQLQKTFTQLQKRTQQVQKKTIQYQRKLTQLQQRVQQLQKRTVRFRACSGAGGTGSCVAVHFDCKPGGVDATGDVGKPYCYVTNDTGWVDQNAACTASSTETLDTFCQTSDSGFVNAGTCSGSSTAYRTVSCQTITTQDWTNSNTCSANIPIDATGLTVSCREASNSGWANAGTCSNSDPAGGPTITCQTTDTGFVNAASCTNKPLDAGGETISCQSTASSTVNTGTCSVGTSATGETITACPTTNPAFANLSATSCTDVPINASGATFECNTVTPATWTQGASCTSATSFNSSGQKRLCQEKSGTDTGWVSIPGTATGTTCSASSGGSSTKARSCQTLNDTGWQNAGTCTASGSTATPRVTCQTLGPTVNSVGSCTAGPIDAAGKTVTLCSTTNPAWTNTGSCTVVPINASGQTVECQTTTPAWSNIGVCPAGPFPMARDASGLTVLDCRVASDTTVNVGFPACSASSPANGPIVTCIPGTPTTVNVGALPATCTNSNPAAGPTVTCNAGTPSAAVDVASCTVGDQTATGPTITCPTRVVSQTNVGPCTAVPFDSATGITITCPVISDVTVYVGALPTYCSDSNPAAGPTVTCTAGTPLLTSVASCSASDSAIGPTVTCQKLSDSGMNNSGKCTASGVGVQPTVTCSSSVVSAWADVASCTTDDAASPSIECQNVTRSGHQLQYRSQQTDTMYRGQNQSDTNYGSTTGAWSGWQDLAVCSATVPTVPANGAAPAAGPPTPPGSCTAWPCETAVNTYGSSESLADVAQYYYKTDLRTTALGNCGVGDALCPNNIKPVGTTLEEDKASWQHMVTFTLGLGVSGSLTYDKNYKQQTTGDFADLRNGTKDWPVPVRSGNTDNDLATPAYAIDDLWHAAVNGRGQYFSAASPEDVITGLGNALNAIDAVAASGSGAAGTSQQLLASGNLAFVTTYLTKKWTGNLQAFEIDALSGALGVSAAWDAQAKLDLKTKSACDNRVIKLFRKGATNNLVDFKLTTYSCDSGGAPTGAAVDALDATEQAYFGATAVAGLSQFSQMSAAQRTAAAGANLVNYLRGQRGKETFVIGNTNNLFRQRDHVLGDIVYAAPVYVKAPFAGYDDPGYAAFKTAQAGRVPMVYAAANDGMLHAFYAGTSASDITGGTEAWAFIPTTALPKLYKIASENYGNEHTFLVDGTPVVNDVCSSDCAVPTPPATSNPVWNTILVAGLRNGGRGYYALDVTDPATPKALWEFKWSSTCFDPLSVVDQFADCHIGLTYGEPVIAKLMDGRWVVFVSSGYNNINSPTVAGDGKGYLYVLEAMTGKILYKIEAGSAVGSDTTPSGMAHINARAVETLRDNTAAYVYGTDLLGNVWRFDVNNLISPSGVEGTLLAQVVDGSGVPQPITTKPQIGVVNNEPYVYVGTGQYLGTTDLGTTQTQSVWGIKDPLSATAVTNLRTTFRKITTVTVGGETSTTAYRTNSCTANCSSTFGWFTDLPASGERVNIDMKLDLGTLLVASNLPPASACEIGGSSWLNFFDASSGTAVAGSLNSSTGSRVLNALGELTQVVGLNIIRTATGQVKVQATTRQGGISNPYVAFSTPAPTGKRVSWREIISQ